MKGEPAGSPTESTTPNFPRQHLTLLKRERLDNERRSVLPASRRREPGESLSSVDVKTKPAVSWRRGGSVPAAWGPKPGADKFMEISIPVAMVY